MLIYFLQLLLHESQQEPESAFLKDFIIFNPINNAAAKPTKSKIITDVFIN